MDNTDRVGNGGQTLYLRSSKPTNQQLTLREWRVLQNLGFRGWNQSGGWSQHTGRWERPRSLWKGRDIIAIYPYFFLSFTLTLMFFCNCATKYIKSSQSHFSRVIITEINKNSFIFSYRLFWVITFMSITLSKQQITVYLVKVLFEAVSWILQNQGVDVRSS